MQKYCLSYSYLKEALPKLIWPIIHHISYFRSWLSHKVLSKGSKSTFMYIQSQSSEASLRDHSQRQSTNLDEETCLSASVED